jgi:hypothetical protein
MPEDWKEIYSELKSFINHHPDIKIKKNVTNIPESLKNDFYRLFDQVRTLFVQNKCRNLLNEAAMISEGYLAAEKEVIELLSLQKVSMPDGLSLFLHNPVEELIKGLFGLLFDLLSFKIDVRTFENSAMRNVESSFNNLSPSGYEKWGILSLVKMLNVDKLFDVEIRKFVNLISITQGGTFLSANVVQKPAETNSLAFKPDSNVICTVPDFICHSPVVNGFFAVKADMRRSLGRISSLGTSRESHAINAEVEYAAGLTLIYFDNNLDNLNILGDREKMLQPDLIIQYTGQVNWLESKKLDNLKIVNDNLKPKSGILMATLEALSKNMDMCKKEHILSMPKAPIFKVQQLF